eukprot:2889137-Prymnesium_polylepis.1
MGLRVGRTAPLVHGHDQLRQRRSATRQAAFATSLDRSASQHCAVHAARPQLHLIPRPHPPRPAPLPFPARQRRMGINVAADHSGRLLHIDAVPVRRDRRERR